MNAMDRMLIEHQCVKQIYRYAMLNDRKDWTAVVEMFVEAGRFARPSAPGDVIEGRAAILESFLGRPAGITQHIVSSVIVDVKSEKAARATSLIQLYVGVDEGGAVPVHKLAAPFVGGFHDRLERVGEDWLFAERIGFLTIK